MKTILRNFGAVAVVLAAIAANARERANITVPFAFNAAGMTMPAGQYRISFNETSNLITLLGGQQTRGVCAQHIDGRSEGCSDFPSVRKRREPVHPPAGRNFGNSAIHRAKVRKPGCRENYRDCGPQLNCCRWRELTEFDDYGKLARLSAKDPAANQPPVLFSKKRQ
jgi:hypothetical protein